MNLRKISALLVCMMLAVSVLISAAYAEEGGANPTVEITGGTSVDAGNTLTLTAVPSPNDSIVTWTISDPSSAVTFTPSDKTAQVTAKQVSADATVSITATATKDTQTGSKTITVTVKAKQAPPPTPSSTPSSTPQVSSAPPTTTSKAPATATSSAATKVYPTGVKLQGPDAVEVGKMIPLLAVLEPDGADRTVTWLSSDMAVASVSHGQVTGISPGTTVITVFTSKDNVKVSKTITVVPAGSLAGTDSTVSDVSSAASSGLVLPAVSAVGQGDIYSGIEVVPPSSRASILGLIAWICIILGIVIVLLVLFSGKRTSTGLPGKKRYHRKPAKGHKKRLLDDRYYRNYRKK